MWSTRFLAGAISGLIGAVVLSAVGCSRPTAPELNYNPKTALTMREVLSSGVDAAAGPVSAGLGEPTGWATLSGRFRINGPPPTRETLIVNKDTDVCAPNGGRVLGQSIVVGPSDGIENVLIFISSKLPSDDPKWEHEDYLANKFGEVEFDQKNCIFLSHVAAYRATQKVKVLNSDPVGHNTNIDSKRGAAAGNFTVAANSYAYYEPGAASPAPFPVSCSIHPWMKAWMMICDHPYFAVTQPDGSFEIANVPADVELEYRVWQERANYLQEVTVNGQAERWSRGKFTLKLAPGEEKTLDVAVNNSVFQ